MGISHFHVKHKKPTRRVESTVEAIEKRATCTLYKTPDFGQTYDSLQPLSISWDPTCISSSQIDIYLISPTSDTPRIHIWEKVTNSDGSYTAELMPRWWNATAKQSLQISIIGHDTPIFLSEYPAGPVFYATYEEPTTGTPDSANTNLLSSGVTTVNATSTSSMNSGKTAVAVILPLLFVIICIGAYIKVKRTKGIKDRKRWTEAVDKRMSTISTDWKSVSGAGANAAIRNSMAVGNRNSSFSFGAIRPSSQFASIEGEEGTKDKREMSQMRTGVGLRNPAGLTSTSTDRVSRVSFAPDTRVSRVSFADSRPSGESRRTRAFHSAYIPPVPALPDTSVEGGNTSTEVNSDDGMAQFSPRQTQGPMALTPEYISTNVSAARQGMSKENNGDLADFMPALSMMRTGGNQAESDDYLLPSPSVPAPPTPTHPKPISSTPATMSSPVMSTLPMQPMPAAVMSPDDMLKAYAERKKSMALSGAGGAKAAGISYPMPAANSTTSVPGTPTSNNMRVLYDAATGSIAPGPPPMQEADARTEYTMSQYSAAESYQHEAAGQYAFGAHHYNVQIGGGAGVGAYGNNTHQHTGSVGVGAYGGARYAIGDDEDDLGRQAYGGHAA